MTVKLPPPPLVEDGTRALLQLAPMPSMHAPLTGAEDEAVVLAVSTPREVGGASKKTVRQLDDDAQLECVLRLAVRTPREALPRVAFA